MEFGSNREGFCFSSSPLYKTQQLLPALNNNKEIINTTHQQQIEETASTKQQLMKKEHMFDKVVTPSDVGKLNRLVIPKQYAEKYFPLDSSTNEKGLLLNFEDRNGKPWRFRYSYWNSSQSYVITKGWSRFVKDKKLDAGDIVSFQRGLGDLGKDRLFIDWRTRPDAPHPSLMRPPSNFYNRNSSYYGTSTNVISPCFFYLRSQPQPAAATSLHPQQPMGMVEWQKQQHPIVFDSVPGVQGKAAAKRLRLFGVNMDCPITESDECDITMAINHPSSSSQLRLYDATPMPPFDFLSKGKASMSFDSSGI